MKKMILICALVFSVMPFAAKAGFWDVVGAIYDAKHPHPQPQPNYPPPYYPGGYYPGQVSCTYTDTGWEEHFRGHNSCGECLQAHGNCNETCYAENQICEATGVDQFGKQVTVTGESSDRGDAERRAYDSCYYHGLRDCRVQKCDSEQQQISKRLCR